MAVAGLCGALSYGSAAWADELLTGAVRDQDGAVVAGASVRAVDAHGRVLARDVTARDGTFAVSAETRPAAIVVQAAHADPARVTVPDTGPVGVVVHRHRADDLVPSAADIAALPAASLGAVAALIPYRVSTPSAISDRWLSGGRGVTTVDGLPFYRRGDGADATSLLPSHAFGAIAVSDPLEAPWYGDRAGGGVVDARLFDRIDRARVTDRDASVEAGGNLRALAAESFDPDGDRRVVAASGGARAGPIDASAVVIAGTAPGTYYAGAGANVRAATRTFDVGAHVGLTRDDATAGGAPDDGSVADVSLDASARGPNAIAMRVRWRGERGLVAHEGDDHHDAALVFGTARGSAVRVSATVALAYGDEHAYETPVRNALAVLPAITVDAPLGGGWTVQAGERTATLGTPGYAIARSTLAQAGLSFDDRRHVIADLLAFTESDAAPLATNRGIAAALGWEVARNVSIRAWSLRDGDVVDIAAPVYPGGPVQTTRATHRFDRDVVWLTWDAATRFDFVLRPGAIEGGIRVPLGKDTSAALGSFIATNGARTLTFGITAR